MIFIYWIFASIRVIRDPSALLQFFNIRLSAFGFGTRAGQNALTALRVLVILLMRFPILRAMLLLLMTAACVSAGQTPAESGTGIEGVITISPTRPGPVRADAPVSQPLANATFVVKDQNGDVASFTTDHEGRFRTPLPPGHYKVSLKGKTRGVGRYGPFEVDVRAGQMTKVQWQCDSGMR